MNWQSVLDRVSSSVFELICHQDPAILMHTNGKAVMLCPRCIGLQLGFLSVFRLLATWTKRNRLTLSCNPTYLIVAAAAALTPLHWTLCRAGVIAPDLAARLATGLASGAALAILLRLFLSMHRQGAEEKVLQLRLPHIVGLISVSNAICAAVVSMSGWCILTSLVFISVLTNAAIATRTIIGIARRFIDTDPRISTNGG